jgi:hypothetical protein
MVALAILSSDPSARFHVTTCITGTAKPVTQEPPCDPDFWDSRKELEVSYLRIV